MSMLTEKPCVVLDITGVHRWAELSFPRSSASDPRAPDYCRQRIPDLSRSTVLHPNRRVAEAEALRLNANNLDHLYVVFEATSLAKSVDVPTHVNIHGHVMQKRSVASVFPLDEEAPF